MTLTLSDKDLKTLRRLGNALSSEVIPVAELRGFISGLQQKVEAPASAPKRARLKESRKDHFRKKLHSV